MALNLQDIIRMIAPTTDGLGNVSDSEVANFRETMLRNKLDEMRRLRSSGLGQVSNMEADAMRAALEGAAKRGMPTYESGAGIGQVSDAEAAVMNANPTLSLPPAEGMPNYADNQAPLAVGGGLLADEAQMLMSTAYDMSAPREMRINAINRLRELGY